jgi:hypothetical protein
VRVWRGMAVVVVLGVRWWRVAMLAFAVWLLVVVVYWAPWAVITLAVAVNTWLSGRR